MGNGLDLDPGVRCARMVLHCIVLNCIVLYCYRKVNRSCMFIFIPTWEIHWLRTEQNQSDYNCSIFTSNQASL